MDELQPLTINHGGQIWPMCLQGQEPLVKDLDVGAWLEYERPRDIRKLIERHAEQLGEVSRHGGAKPSADGGRPEECYFLQEHQVLYLVAKAETPKANELLQTMIAVFMLARRGLLGAPGRYVAVEAFEEMERGCELLVGCVETLVKRVDKLEQGRARQGRRFSAQVAQLALKLDQAPAAERPARAAPGCTGAKAQAWLLVKLTEGARPAAEMQAAALAEGITQATLKRARAELRVIAERRGGVAGAGAWWWRLPSSEVN